MLKTELLPHQEKTLEFAMKVKFYGDFSCMGTGKSAASLALICKTGLRAVVVCPPSLVSNWLAEISKHTTLIGSPHFINPDPKADVIVIPYTQLNKAEKVFAISKIVIADEGHYLKNLQAKRTEIFHSYFYKYLPEYFGYLSGTPIKNNIPEIYSFLLLLAKGPSKVSILDKYHSFYLFCSRFTNVRTTTFGTKFEGMKNVEELRTYINPFTIRHGEGVLNLPQLNHQSVVAFYNEDPILMAEYQKFLKTGIPVDIKSKSQAAAAKAVFTAGFVKEAIAQGRGPIVVFSDHVKPLEIMKLELSGLNVRTISGKNRQGRQDSVDLLNKKQIDVLLCTIGTASAGFNMTGANILVCNDPSWVPTDMEQMEKRIHRIGTTQDCLIVNIIGSKTDEYIYEMLKKKTKVINKVIKERA